MYKIRKIYKIDLVKQFHKAYEKKSFWNKSKKYKIAVVTHNCSGKIPQIDQIDANYLKLPQVKKSDILIICL